MKWCIIRKKPKEKEVKKMSTKYWEKLRKYILEEGSFKLRLEEYKFYS